MDKRKIAVAIGVGVTIFTLATYKYASAQQASEACSRWVIEGGKFTKHRQYQVPGDCLEKLRGGPLEGACIKYGQRTEYNNSEHWNRECKLEESTKQYLGIQVSDHKTDVQVDGEIEYINKIVKHFRF